MRRYQPPRIARKAEAPIVTLADARPRYLQSLKATGAKANTLAGLQYGLGLAEEFLDGILLVDIRRDHIEQLAGAYEERCKKALTFSESLCTAGFPLETCPWLHGGDTATCPGYTANQASSVQTFLGGVSGCFEWLVENDVVAANPVRGVLKSHARRNKASLTRKRMTPGKGIITVGQWRILVPAAKWNTKPMWELAGKNGLRPHEGVKLLRSGYDRANRRIPIPEDITDLYGNKRIGWAWVLLDNESVAILEAYLARRDALPAAAKHDLLFVTDTGKPWSPRNWDKTVRKSFKRDLKNAKLAIAATPHSLRGMWNTHIRDAPDAVRTLLRGGKLPGHEGNYIAVTDAIRADWERYHPRLGAKALAAALQF